jgi:hypothetical protein
LTSISDWPTPTVSMRIMLYPASVQSRRRVCAIEIRKCVGLDKYMKKKCVCVTVDLHKEEWIRKYFSLYLLHEVNTKNTPFNQIWGSTKVVSVGSLQFSFSLSLSLSDNRFTSTSEYQDVH